MTEKSIGSEATSTSAMPLAVYVRGSAHEFANPLNAITMYAELVKSLLAREEPTRAIEMLDRLLASCAQCGKLVHGFRRFGAGLATGESEQVSIQSVIAAAIEQASSERTTFPKIEMSKSDHFTYVDKNALQCAIVELLFNACEANAGLIRISIAKQGNQIIVDFHDDGTGVAPEIRHKIVEPFFSTYRQNGQAGLGLNLVQQILNANGGTLQIPAASANPDGTCMRMRLKTCEAQAA